MIIVIEPALSKVTIGFYSDSACLLDTKTIVPNGMDSVFETALASAIESGARESNTSAISVRVIWGSDELGVTEVLDERVLGLLESSVSMSPSYRLVLLRLLGILGKLFNRIPIFLFFETGFFRGVGKSHSGLAIPEEICEIPQFSAKGTAGIAHGYNSRVCEAGMLLSVFLGNHSSVCAIMNGQPLFSSTGATFLEGIMGERSCGDLDPGILFFLMRELGVSVYKVDDILKNKSGFVGVTGKDRSIPELFSLYGTDERVTLAFDIFSNHILKYVADGLSLLRGIDEIVFAGPYMKPLVPFVSGLLSRLAFLGIRLLPQPWLPSGGFRLVSDSESGIKVHLNYYSVSEMIANETTSLIREKIAR
jgi:acetate kinase